MTDEMKKVAAEPCRCVSCGDCNGDGHVRVEDPVMDYELEPCENCGGSGIIETCDRCQLLEEMDHERV